MFVTPHFRDASSPTRNRNACRLSAFLAVAAAYLILTKATAHQATPGAPREIFSRVAELAGRTSKRWRHFDHRVAGFGFLAPPHHFFHPLIVEAA
jgi:hypothetical protein